MLLLISASVLALGVGRVRTTSSLGATLDFTAALLVQPGESVESECIRADVYAGESRIADALVRVSVERATNGTPRALRIVTAVRIDEPLVRVDLNMQCGASIRRSFVVFIDPPGLDLARTERFAGVDDAAAPVSRRRAGETGSAAASAARRAARQSAARRADAQAMARGGQATAVRSPRRQASTSAPAARTPRSATAPSVRSDSAGSSLKLESTPVLRSGTAPTGGTAGTAATTVAPAGGSASATETARSASAANGAPAAVSGLLGELASKAEADSQLAAAEKLRSLDQELSRVRSDNDALKKTTADLQARLRAAEQDRSSNTLIYGLAGALLLLLLAVVALLMRNAAMRREADWLQAAAAAAAPPAGEGTVGAVRSIVHPSTSAAGRSATDAAATASARASEAAAITAASPAPAAAAVAGLAVGAATRTPSATEAPHERTAIQESA